MSLSMTDSMPSTSQASLSAETISVTVGDRRTLAEDVDLFTLTGRDGDLPSWNAGAHIDVHLSPGLVRQYSLCGDPREPGEYQIAVLRQENGRGGSTLLHKQLTVGSDVRISAPRNRFPLVDAQRYIFVAGGIGITPILTMLAEVEQSGSRWQLVYGGRTRSSMAFLPHLRQYGDHITVLPQDECGLLDLEDALGLPASNTAVYCCGPESLLTAAEEHCRSWPPGTLHLERFTPAEVADDSPADAFTVHFAASGISTTVPANMSIVDAAEECGVFIPASCRDGVCGTCETRVIAGRPDHRDSLLSDDERESGETILACVSRCVDNELHLDI